MHRESLVLLTCLCLATPTLTRAQPATLGAERTIASELRATAMSGRPLGAVDRAAGEPAAWFPSGGEPSRGQIALGGLVLGAGGFLVGGGVGVMLASGCSTGRDEYCGLKGAFLGAAAGGTLAMALGVHLANDRRGHLGVDMLTGAGVWALGIGLASASGWDETVTMTTFVVIPIAQIISTVAVERAIGRKRAAR